MDDGNPQSSILDPQGCSAGWAASVLFWACLLLAAGLFAVAALAPKLQTNLKLNRHYYENQAQLVAMERETQSLQRVIEALQTDPDFVDELARVDFRAARLDEERIPVAPGLSVHGTRPAVPTSPSTEWDVWYAPLLESFIVRREVRWALLASAVLLVLAAFAFMHEPRTDSGDSAVCTRGTGLRWLVQRYRRPVDSG